MGASLRQHRHDIVDIRTTAKTTRSRIGDCAVRRLPVQGQLEEMEAPAGKPVPVAISASAAVKLAYYRDTGKFGVLAPRGWYCLGVLGSGTEEMFVSPEPIDPARISSGPGIEMKLSFGPVGRLDAAAMIARAFPSYWWFADEVVAGDEHLAASFIFGPYPKDKVIRHGETVVEFETPPRTEGLGRCRC